MSALTRAGNRVEDKYWTGVRNFAAGEESSHVERFWLLLQGADSR